MCGSLKKKAQSCFCYILNSFFIKIVMFTNTLLFHDFLGNLKHQICPTIYLETMVLSCIYISMEKSETMCFSFLIKKHNYFLPQNDGMPIDFIYP